MTEKPAAPNWIDRTIAYLWPMAGLRRAQARRAFSFYTGHESAKPSRSRRFSRNTQSGESLAQTDAVAIRNQARQLERDMDIARGALDKLVDFTIGSGINVEPQPKRRDGSIHEEFAQILAARYAEWSKWPEVTWTHNRGAMERLAARTLYRDGEVFGQLITGPRADQAYGSPINVAIECLEPDLLPYDDLFGESGRIRQGIERNLWGRPVRYHFYKQHPGDDRYGIVFDTKAVPAERVLHVRNVDRFGQLRGISLFASVAPRLQDTLEYETDERMAAKMAASMVMKITRGDASMWGEFGNKTWDPEKPPLWRMDGGIIYTNTSPGEDVEFFDTRRPNVNAEPFTEMQIRRAAAGFGLSYSAMSRNYNGTYSAQRQELVENWPHYHALTGIFVAQWSQPAYEAIVADIVLREGMPLDVDPRTVFDADFLGPPMPWIDPEKEANAQIMLVQACFKSSAAVIRERNGNWRQTYKQLGVEREARADEQIGSTVEVPPANVSSAKPSGPEPAPESNRAARGADLRVIK